MQYPELVSHAILIGASPPGKKTSMPEKIFWERALKTVNDLEDMYILFYEPESELSKNAARLSFGRISKRTEDLDIEISKECYDNQRKAAAYNWEEIKATVEVNFPNYGHSLLSTKEFIDICS